MDSGLGIPGDGRCLFRSVVHGACLRTGKPSPSESLEKELADELRHKVADEFIKRRRDTEWFIEDDFDTYVVKIRQPHVWGGEPELLMSSHVLKMPITVYMRDRSSGSRKDEEITIRDVMLSSRKISLWYLKLSYFFMDLKLFNMNLTYRNLMGSQDAIAPN
ncbi:hypothetical protein D5086_016986 [Populus alba]|uniref:Uncharacterized protein n=1 Tax=Populus alba TaxID=43335 RepID=A0ACC4BWX0_POPAL